MGPFVLAREQSATARDWTEENWDEHLPELAEQRHVAIGHVLAARLPVLQPAIARLGNPNARHWIVDLMTNFAVLGGFVVAPVLTLAAWLGLIMADGTFLHRLSSTLFVVSLIWICAAVVMAHVHESLAASSRD